MSSRDVVDRQDEVDHAGAHGAAHHAVVLGALLGDGQPALLLDRAQAERAVAARAGEDEARRALALGTGERLEEGVDRRALPAALRRHRPEPEMVVLDGQRLVGRDDIDAVGLDLDAVARLDHRQLGAAIEQGR